MFSLAKNAYNKALALGAVAVGAGTTFLAETFAFTTDPVTGFPVVESTDTSTMLSGVGSAANGLLNYMVSNWKVIVAIIVVGAIVGFTYSLLNRTKGAVRGH